MDEPLKTCACGREFTESQSAGKLCFKCKLSGVSFNWVGGGSYGRKAFHDKTVTEVQNEIVARSTSLGVKAEKKSTRAELI